MRNSIATQMRDAPRNSIYIWVNQYTEFPRQVAKDIGRPDIQVESPYWLKHGWIGKKISGIVLDPCINFTPEIWKDYNRALQSIIS